jgi:uncharacterized surface protein with fasciclin (FAS1) repeats
MVIVASYFAGEHYGLLGPQLAATIIEDHTPYECIVLALTRNDTMDLAKTAIKDYANVQQLVVGFSTLSGRTDLFQLAKALKEEGIITILGGSQPSTVLANRRSPFSGASGQKLISKLPG